ncbi:MAG TPA: class I SAM-dependent methyltransferase [Verrucomicrobiae bacterium]|jgi:extracellular factor (EF) 3-hydroxypalmitic acid methyl ester biosynthesis protein
MKQALTGHGHGAGSQARRIPPAPVKAASVDKGNQVTFQTAEHVKLHGSLSRVTRHLAVFELYSPIVTPRFSEVLSEFTIVMQSQAAYSGRAVLSKVLDAGTKVICEAMLDAMDWQDLNLISALQKEGQIAREFREFLAEWQKNFKVAPEFKVAVADMQTFLEDFRLWMEQTELKLQAQPFDRQASERKILEALVGPVMPGMASLFERFERLIHEVPKDSQAAAIIYAKRMLHPSVLCAPFMRRTFEKPLGYAGDYEMVNMMTRDPFQGDSLFAKVLNTFFLNTPPVVAHRNRIDSLTEHLHSEVFRRSVKGKPTKIFNLGCGPAMEIQRFLAKSPMSDNVEFTLLDFNDETIEYTQRNLAQVCRKYDSDCMIRVLKKSVAQLIKDSSAFPRGSFDMVYCAGLFDYLPDPVCSKLMAIFWNLVAPGGLLLVSNVHSNNPSRGWMEYMVDWHLIYRDAEQMHDILPPGVPKDKVRIFVEEIGVNIFAEIRRPQIDENP